jgi:membrane associated rhomboid family serine protease
MYSNRFYTFEKIFWITALISAIYLPVALVYQDLATIGISGTCYFLLVRGIFFRGRKPIKRTRILAYLLISLIILSEIIRIGENDHISHSVHLLGCVLGIISLYPNKLKIIHEKIYEIIS